MSDENKAMLKVVFAETSPWTPVFVVTSVSNLCLSSFRAPETVLSFVSRENGGNAGPSSGHGVKERAEEKSKKNVEA